MKNTNAKTHKNTKRKLAIMVTTIATGLFALISNNAIVQAAELVKAEPIKQVSLYQEAKESLALSFDSLAINQNFNNEAAKNTMAKQQSSASTNQPITLTKTILASE